MELVERPRSRRRPNDFLRRDEDAAVLEAPESVQERALVHLLRWTGLRVSEACALTWRDLDFDRGEIRVGTAKTEAGTRAVPIPPELDAVARAWLARQVRAGLFEADAPVLATRNGTPMKEAFAWRLVKRVARRAGVRVTGPGALDSAVSPHTLRRTYATDLLNRGVREEVVSKLLGHADTRTTSAYYAELLDATARREVLAALRH